MQKASNNGALIMMPAENGIAIDVLAAQAVARGDTDPIWHGRTRPSALEGEATHRAIVLAGVAGAPVYFVHMSASEALAAVAAARDAGRNVFAETCPQYLYLTLEDQLGAPGFEGAKWVASPPLRSKHEHHLPDLWKGLRTDDLTVVSTDHCPFCMKDQKELGIGNFTKIPNGIGTVEHRMNLIYQGVVDGKLSLARWVETCSTTPARLFGMYPRKGVIAPGSDADLVVYDPNGHSSLGLAAQHMNMDYSAWEGFEIDGAVDTVLSRGSVVMSDGAFRGGPATAGSSGAGCPTCCTRSGGIHSGLRCGAAGDTAGGAGDRAGQAGGAARLPGGVDVRLAPALGGAVRHPQPDPGRDPDGDRRPDGHQPGDPGLDGDGVDVRDAQRDVR